MTTDLTRTLALGASRVDGHIELLNAQCPNRTLGNSGTGHHVTATVAPADALATVGPAQFGPYDCGFVDTDTGELCGATGIVVDDMLGDAYFAALGLPELERLYRWVGVDEDEIVALCSEIPGEQDFTTEWVGPMRDVGAHAARAMSRVDEEGINLWMSVYALDPDRKGNRKTRGKEGDVARVPALRVDIDIKKRGVASLDEAWAVVRLLEADLGAKAFVVMTGHGLQAYFRLGSGHALEIVKKVVIRVQERARQHAQMYGGDVDLFPELNRVHRVPGSVNVKVPAAPVRAEIVQEPAREESPVLDPWALERLLDDIGVPAAGDVQVGKGPVVSSSADWELAAETCGYVRKMVAGWAEDDRPPSDTTGSSRSTCGCTRRRAWDACRART